MNDPILPAADLSPARNAIAAANGLPALRLAAAETRRLAASLLGQGATAEHLVRGISSLNDLLTVRIIEATAADYELPAVQWCWLAFGSEGRLEQTLATDQDNGLIFVAEEGEAEQLRQRFLPFARMLNDRLDACGFPLCKGGVMASNPALCLSLAEWRSKFSDWLYCVDVQALLNATIYFDFRTLYGENVLAEKLRDWLLVRTREAPMFLRFMAENALRVAPPLGFIREFVYDDDARFPHTLELKASATRLFVDAARIFALAAGARPTSTVERLRAVSGSLHFREAELEEIIAAFHFVLRLRLQNQVAGGDVAGANRVDPARLPDGERRQLKEALKQAKKLQTRLQLDYRL